MNEDYVSGFLTDQQPLQPEVSAPELFYTSASGYSQIFLIRRLGRMLLLKGLKPEYREQSFFEQALYKEFRIGYQLEHKHICRTESWEHVEGIGNCIVMEYVDGQTLEALINSKKPLGRSMAWRIATEIADALSYLHSKQTLHRDLKPSNILITHRGEHVKLIDFSLSDTDDSCVLKDPAGTPFYMAPEATSGNGQCDERADIYSLGIIMNEMARLTGDRQMRAIANRCSRTNPEERYRSAQSLLADLQKQRTGRRWIWPAAACIAAAALLWWGSGGRWRAENGTADGNQKPLPQTIVMGKGNVVVADAKQLFLNDTLEATP